MKKKLIAILIPLCCSFLLIGAVNVNGVKLFQSYIDFTLIAAPANPTKGFLRLFGDTATTKMGCLDSTGASCLPTGGGSTNTGTIVYQPGTWPGTIGIVASAGGSFTTGTKFVVTSTGKSVKGFNLSWASVGGGKTVKITLWDLGANNMGGMSLGTATGAVNATGVYEIDFMSPIAVTQYNYYTAAMWDDSGAVYMVANNIDGQQGIARVPYAFPNDAAIVADSLFAAGDNQPVTTGGEHYVVEPIFQ